MIGHSITSSVLLFRVTERLKEKQLKVATAESCTGGLVAGLLTALPGSSQWFERGFVTYSNLAKEEMLNVPHALLESEGAVSEAVAKAMALGALTHSHADISLAITGIAGPDGGSVEKPVGTVWFAFAKRPHLLQSHCCQWLDLPRHAIRDAACKEALKGILSFLA